MAKGVLVCMVFTIIALIGLTCVYGGTIKPTPTQINTSVTSHYDIKTATSQRRSVELPHKPGSSSSHGDKNGTEQHNGTEAPETEVHHEHSIHVASWHFDYVQSPFIIAAFLLIAGIAKLGFHHANFLSSKVPESCLLIILGTGVGAILYAILPEDGDIKLGLTSDLFFLYLLPPIILESAFSLHDRTFYENVGTTLIYAVMGTVLNCFLIAPSLYGIYTWGGMGTAMPELKLIQCLVFSAIIVAVDPVAVLAIFQEVGVNNTLYFLVFGESLLNDAVTVVLYNMMKTFNLMEHITAGQVMLGIVQFFVVSLGGLTIGILLGVLTAIVTRFTAECRVVEPLAVFVLAYLAYLMAEMFHLSGIISIIGCGLTQAQYAFHNISRKSYTTVKYFSKMMSATSDCVIFMFLGVALFKREVLNVDNWHVGFILWTIFFCLFYRFLVVFFLTFLINRRNVIRKIGLEEQFIMAYGGLRGAVAFSLVDVLKQQNLPKGPFFTTTVAVIFFTVFIQGSTIKPLVKMLRVRMEEKQKMMIGEEINVHVTDHVMAGIEEILGKKGEHYVRELLEYYNSHYLKMWLQRDPISADEQIMQFFEKLALEQHFENLAGSKMIMEKYGSETALVENISIQDDEEPSDDDDDNSSNNLIIPVPSPLHNSTEDIPAEMDDEIRMHQVDRRRKSMYTVALPKDVEHRLNDNPTAQDVRKIMVPTRRQLQFKRLDKNLKSEDSENDLIRYLQDKKSRTRRMSHAVWNMPISEEEPEVPKVLLAPRRKSVAPTVLTDNYRRRLSLAVPDMQFSPSRKRGVSVGNVLRGIDSPSRRRLRFKRRTTSEASDDLTERGSTPSLAAIHEDKKDKEKTVGFTLDVPEDEDKSDEPATSLNVISENADDESPESSGKPTRATRPHTRHGLLKKRSQSQDSDTTSPTRRLLNKRGASLDFIEEENAHNDPFNRHSVSRSSGKSNKSLPESGKSPERTVKFVSSKDSPSVKRKTRFQNPAMSFDIEETPEGDAQTEQAEKESGKLRKNVSYTRAVSLDEFPDRDNAL